MYKPPGIHSAPSGNSKGETLLDWCMRRNPEIADLPGRKKGEGGLLHRLDYETHGLMLFARTLPGMEYLIKQQKAGSILKEYSALTAKKNNKLPGFPEVQTGFMDFQWSIKSAFRPYGEGRKAVRPVINCDSTGNVKGKHKELALDKGKPYVTEILEIQSILSATDLITIRIYRGFRHQIRCHLAWIGQPIINDELYGGFSYGLTDDSPCGRGFLGLRAFSLAFSDPSTGKKLRYEIPHSALL